MIRSHYPWLTDHQFALCEVVERAREKMNAEARIVCSRIEAGLEARLPLELLRNWKLARDAYETAINVAEAARLRMLAALSPEPEES